MAVLSFSQIFFAIAIFLLGNGNASKITVSKDGKIAGTWVLQADGQWHGTESIQIPDSDTGLWSFDSKKMTLMHRPSATEAGAKDETIDFSTMLKPSPEKPDPATLDVNGRVLTITRHGDDIVLTAKDPSPGVELNPITIHYEKSAASSPQPKTSATP